MALIENPYQARINKIKGRLEAKPKVKTNLLKTKLKALQGQKQIYGLKNPPAPATPFDPTYQFDVAAAERAKAFGGAQMGLSEAQIEAEYGRAAGTASARAGINEAQLAAQERRLGESEGIVRNRYGIDDTSNPLAAARQLEKAYSEQQNRTSNTYAARGQLYSGALGRAKTEDVYRKDVAYDELKQAYEDRLRQLAAQREDLGFQRQGLGLEGDDLAAQKQAALDQLYLDGQLSDIEYQDAMESAAAESAERQQNLPVDPSSLPTLGKAGLAVKQTGAKGTKAITQALLAKKQKTQLQAKKQDLKAKIQKAPAKKVPALKAKVVAVNKKLKKL